MAMRVSSRDRHGHRTRPARLTMYPQQVIAAAVDRAKWVRFHAATSRLLVWRTGEMIDVLDVQTGRVLGNWLCEGTVESAAAAIEERLNAGY